MIESVIIIGEGRERENERGKEVGRSIDPDPIQSNLGGHEGTVMLGTKRRRSRRLPRGRDHPHQEE